MHESAIAAKALIALSFLTTQRAMNPEPLTYRVLVLRGLIAVFLLVLASSAFAGVVEKARLEDTKTEVLSLLHDGRFDEADRLAAAIERDGENTTEAFFRAFVAYWQLLYDPRNETLRKEFDRRLTRTIDLAKKTKGNPGEKDAELWRGSAHLLRAQLRATQKKVFSAAFEAKRANKWLKQAVADGSRPVESDFGLGTYEYFADRVPTMVKGLRALLTIPGGDREQGLERLRRASRESRFFAFEARIVLATIYADDDEGLYDEATTEIENTVERYPDVVAALHAAARINLDLGRYGRALEHLGHALTKTESQPGTAPSVIAALRYYAAMAEFGRFRPAQALDYLRPLLEAPDKVPVNLTRRVERLAGASALLLREPPDWIHTIDREELNHPFDDPEEVRRLRRSAKSLELARAGLELERSGRIEDAASNLETLAASRPEDSTLALLAGRALLSDGRQAAALARLQSAADADDLPGMWVGANRLLAGVAADLTGQRESALNWYGKAIRVRFYGRDAARLFTSRPSTQHDLGLLLTAAEPRAVTESTRGPSLE